jgi:DinB family protein
MRRMAPQTPYSAALGDRDPIAAIREALASFGELSRWSDADFERSYAAGKWSARQVLVHLAQMELAFGTRARLALTTPNYMAQSFDQDRWMARESTLGGREALAALVGAGTMNAEFFASLSPVDRQTTFTHPEYGAISIDWLIHQTAGHQIHHLRQLESIGRR